MCYNSQMPVPPYRPPNLRCFKNREMLRAAPPRPGDFPPRTEKDDWEGQLMTVRFDDGSGRVMKMRARRATPEELREADEWVNKHHAEDLQALADM